MKWLLKTPPKKILGALQNKIIPNLRHLRSTKIRRCRCCQKVSLFPQFSIGEEVRFCVFCRANLRYEMLAEYLRDKHPDIARLDVLELDPFSSLQQILQNAKTYTRTYFDPNVKVGTPRADGAKMADVTKLQFADNSFDLIVSSEVLEHVPDLNAAFKEMRRVLRPGGCHVFTVPPSDATKQLATLRDDKIVHLVMPPEYHGDPLGNGTGILAFWHLGRDFPEMLSIADLDFSVVMGPEGIDKRIIWQARKPMCFATAPTARNPLPRE
jgi:SAM-dependent methyltransferase